MLVSLLGCLPMQGNILGACAATFGWTDILMGTASTRGTSIVASAAGFSSCKGVTEAATGTTAGHWSQSQDYPGFTVVCIMVAGLLSTWKVVLLI